jgi:hypothetical protein
VTHFTTYFVSLTHLTARFQVAKRNKGLSVAGLRFELNLPQLFYRWMLALAQVNAGHYVIGPQLVIQDLDVLVWMKHFFQHFMACLRTRALRAGMGP